MRLLAFLHRARFLAHLARDLALVEAHGLGVSAREADRVSARRKGGEIARLDHFEVPLRNARLGRDLLDRQARFLARPAQTLARALQWQLARSFTCFV